MRILFRIWLEIPRLIRRLGQFIYNLEAGARSAEALLYLHTMQKVWPEAIDEIMPNMKIPSNALPDIASWYILARQPRNLQRQLTDMLVSMAERLVSLPLAPKIALFEEALRIPSDNTEAVFARYIKFLASFGECDERLLEVCDRFYNLGPSIWGIRFINIWGFYLSALLRTGRMDDAREILKRCVKNYGLSAIEIFPPVALFARDNGYSNRKIDRAAELMLIVRENEERGALASYFSGKTVAVVGSSPLECGRGRGSEIDGHDIVIRFNNASAVKSLDSDFGNKTTVLSRNIALPGFQINPSADVVLIPDGLERFSVHRKMIEAFLAASKRGQLVCAIPLAEYRSIMREADIPHLSTGVVVCAYVKRLVPEVSRRDLYGFSHFLDDAGINYGAYKQVHYYLKRHDEPINPNFHTHPLAKEREFLRTLFPCSDNERQIIA